MSRNAEKDDPSPTEFGDGRDGVFSELEPIALEDETNVAEDHDLVVD